MNVARNPVLDQLGRVFEQALNAALALDPFTQESMAKLDGQSIDLHWKDTGIAARLQVRQQRIEVGPIPEQLEPVMRITSTLEGLARVALARVQGAGIPAGALQMSGDIGVAKVLSELIEKYETDFDLPFTNTFGNVWGMQIAAAVKAAIRITKHSVARVVEDLGHYVRDESADAVASGEFEIFAEEVEALRNRGEKLAARVRTVRHKAGRN